MNLIPLFVLCCTILGASAKHLRLTNTLEAQDGEFPYMVSLQIEGFHFCGGSLVSARHVVTAAHCMYQYRADKNNMKRIKAVVGSTYLSGGTPMDIDRITIHPDYMRADTLHADVAVVRLRYPVQFSENVKTINLPPQGWNVPDGLELSVIGFGASKRGGPSSNVLKKMGMNAMDQKACEQSWSPARVSPTLFCAKIALGFGTCGGDSGGPVALKRETLIGLVSSSDEYCGSLRPDLFTKISVFTNFIHNEMKIEN